MLAPVSLEQAWLVQWAIGDWFMKSRFVVFLALVMFALNGAPLWAQLRVRRGEQPAGKYGWLLSLEDGKAEARRSGKPLMVVVRCVP